MGILNERRESNKRSLNKKEHFTLIFCQKHTYTGTTSGDSILLKLYNPKMNILKLKTQRCQSQCLNIDDVKYFSCH